MAEKVSNALLDPTVVILSSWLKVRDCRTIFAKYIHDNLLVIFIAVCMVAVVTNGGFGIHLKVNEEFQT